MRVFIPIQGSWLGQHELEACKVAFGFFVEDIMITGMRARMLEKWSQAGEANNRGAGTDRAEQGEGPG